MKRKLTALCLVLAMLFSLTACGQKETPTEGNKETTGTVSGGEVSGDTIELSYWYSMDGTPGELVQKQIDGFNATVGAEKNIHVTGAFQDWPGTDALTAAMTTDDVDNMPDVIQLFSENVDLVRDWERTAWIEDFITSENATVSKDDLVENMVSAYSLNGKMIGTPYAISMLMLYYNVDLLAEAGYDAPPETIAEMAEVISAIKEKTNAAYGLNVRINQYEFENFIAIQGANGTYFGNNASGRDGAMTELACEEQIAAYLTEWEKVIATGGYKATTDSMNEEFAQGLNAMCMMSSARIPAIANLVGDSFEWGVAAIPKVNANDIGGAFPSGSGLFIIDRDNDACKAAAWEFVQYMISEDAQSMWLDGYSYVPVNKNAANTEEYKKAIAADPRLAIPSEILSGMPSTVVASFCPNSSEVGDVIKNAMLSFADGSVSRDDTYTAIVDGIKAALEDYFRANPID